MYGCDEAVYIKLRNHSTWIALAARGKCTFHAKIKQVMTLTFFLQCFYKHSLNQYFFSFEFTAHARLKYLY